MDNAAETESKRDSDVLDALVAKSHIEELRDYLREKTTFDASVTKVAKERYYLLCLEPDLKEFIEKHKLQSVAIILVEKNISSLNDLAARHQEKDLSGYNLQSKLEVRVSLLEMYDLEEVVALSKLCRVFPTKKRLQSQSWNSLSAHLNDLDNHQLNTVADIWAKDGGDREKWYLAGMDPKCIDVLEDNKIKYDDISTQAVEDLCKTHPQMKTKLTQVLHLKNGLKESLEKAAEQALLKKQTTDAMKAIDTMLTNLDVTQSANYVEDKKKLKDVLDAVKSTEWKVKVNSMSMEQPQQLKLDLEQLKGDVAKMHDSAMNIIPGQHKTDAEIINGAFGGTVTFGINIGMDQNKGTSRAVKPIITKVKNAVLCNPTLEFVKEEETFTEQSAASSYINRMKTMGFSAGANLGVKLSSTPISGSSSGSRNTSTQQNSSVQEKKQVAAKVMTIVVPTKSFNLEYDDIQLTTEAINALRDVTNDTSAKEYMNMYGTHFARGIQTLGGIYWSKNTINTHQKVEHNEEVKGSSTNFQAKGGIDAKFIDASSSVGFDAAKGDADGSQSLSHKYRDQSSIIVLGPPVTDHGCFTHMLMQNNQSWAIIDRGPLLGFLGIWDIIKHDRERIQIEQIDYICSLLKKEWLNNTADSEDSQVLFLRTKAAGDNEKSIPNSEDSAGIYLTKMANTFKNEDLSNWKGFKMTFEKLFDSIQACEKQFSSGAFIGLILGTQGILQYLSDRLDACQGNFILHQNFSELLLSVFTDNFISRLNENGIHLPQKMSDTFKKIQSNTKKTWVVPKVNMSTLISDLNKIDSTDEKSTSRIESILAAYSGSQFHDEELQLWKSLEAKAFQYGLRGNYFSKALPKIARQTMIEEFQNIIERRHETDWILPDPLKRPNIHQRHSTRKGYSKLLRITSTPPKMDEKLPESILYDLKYKCNLAVLPPTTPTTTPLSSPLSTMSRQTLGSKLKNSLITGNVANSVQEDRSTLKGCVDLLSDLDKSGSITVLRWILEKRYLFPFIIPSSGDTKFTCDVEALDFIKTLVLHSNKKGITESLSNDMCYRVAIVSNRKPASSQIYTLIKELFTVGSFHCMDVPLKRCSTMKTVAELGWGFVKSIVDTKVQYKPVVLLNVIGDYKPINQFIEEFADTIILEDSPEGDFTEWPFKPTVYYSFQWKPSVEDLSVSVHEDQPLCELSGTAEAICPTISDEIFRLIDEVHIMSDESLPRSNLKSLCQQFDFVRNTTESRFNISLNISCKNYKRDILVLQRLYKKIGDMSYKPLKEAEYKKRITSYKIENIKRDMVRHSTQTMSDPLLKLFVSALCEGDSETRFCNISKMEMMLIDLSAPFQQRVSYYADQMNQCNQELQNRHQQFRDLNTTTSDSYKDKLMQEIQMLQTRKTTSLKQELDQSILDLSNSAVHLEHLWRELSHLYQSNPEDKTLPFLAARSLLDGFTIELMDGDAGLVNIEWFSGIMDELKHAGVNRVMVLSILGVQSCGKSTLLNTMFGVKLRTSVGRCTRGVNMQLIEADAKEYDYILLLDTEGIKAPELMVDNLNTNKDSYAVWHDNRLATMSILPADASIVLYTESTTTILDEILPMVLSAYLNSKLAAGADNLKSKTFFVINQIDTHESDKLSEANDKLLRSLSCNAALIRQNVREMYTTPGEDNARENQTHQMEAKSKYIDQIFENFDQKKDIKYCGRNKENDIPFDSPKIKFGQEVHDIRQHIHNRLLEGGGWSAKTIENFKDHMIKVWECIETSDFELQFKTATEQRLNGQIMAKFNQYLADMEKLWYTYYENHVKMELEGRDGHGGELTEYIADRVAKEDGLTSHLKNLLATKEYKPWETMLVTDWTSRCSAIKASYEKRISDDVQSNKGYESTLDAYKRQMRYIIRQKYSSSDITLDLTRRREKFDQLFQIQCDEIKEKYPSLSEKVDLHVHDVFENKQKHLQRKSITEDKGKLEQKENDLLNEISEQSLQILSAHNGRTYNDTMVIDCISKIRKMIENGNIRMHVCLNNKIYDMLLKTTSTTLKKQQEEWDKRNGMWGKFRAQRDVLFAYYNMICDGLKEEERFVKELPYFISYLMEPEDLVVEDLSKIIVQEPWFKDHKILQAHCDRKLIQLIDGNHIDELVNTFSRPKKGEFNKMSLLYNDVMLKLITELIHMNLKDIISNMTKRGIDAVENAFKAVEQATVRGNMYKLYTDKLSECNYLSYMKKVDLPSTETSPHDKDALSLFQNVTFTMIEEIHYAFDLRELQYDSLAKATLSFLRTERFEKLVGTAGGIRCGALCPGCRSPCFLPMSDHIHDCVHQPVGLQGRTWAVGKQLGCADCNWLGHYTLFTFESKGKITTFGSMEGWKTLTKSTNEYSSSSKLREYIFAKYNKKIAKMHKVNPTTPGLNTLFKYNHKLDDIRQEIDSIIKQGGLRSTE